MKLFVYEYTDTKRNFPRFHAGLDTECHSYP